ncbi:MAG: hypothetical protein HYX78_01100 [Armatimonadetes bacterium]|nr:hypothetical protein [Armatimonadota bacterium]
MIERIPAAGASFVMRARHPDVTPARHPEPVEGCRHPSAAPFDPSTELRMLKMRLRLAYMLQQTTFLIAIVVLLIASSAAFSASNSECLMCHSARGLSKTGKEGRQVSLHVNQTQFRDSVHGGRLCVDCHIDMAEQKFPHKTAAEPVMCSRCHQMGNSEGAPQASPIDEYQDSVHGKAAAAGDFDAPRCKDCHGYHDVRSHKDPKSRTFRANIPKTCAACHSDSRITTKHNIPVKQPLKLYEKSIHGRAVTGQGLLSAAVCIDCHGFHGIKAAKDPSSTINRPHIPETCGQCHKKVLEDYKISIHGEARQAGIKDAPVCTDCHGEHTIQPASSPDSSVYPTHVVATCSKCHEDARIEKTYGLPANRLSTYIGSYHGIANKYGETTVANCATCHGAHDILPSSNPRSLVNKKNLPQTCGKCHPGASVNFAKGSVHVTPSPEKDKGVYWVRVFYTTFIIGLISSFAGYIGLDLISRWRRRGRQEH